jgi:hypothetical protein
MGGVASFMLHWKMSDCLREMGKRISDFSVRGISKEMLLFIVKI